jgi:hypothetical protein
MEQGHRIRVQCSLVRSVLVGCVRRSFNWQKLALSI